MLWPLPLVCNLYLTEGKVAFLATFPGLGLGPDVNESVGCGAVFHVVHVM